MSSSSRRRSQGPPEPEKVEDAFSTETLNQLAEERMRDIKHIVVYRRRVPSRETVEAYPQTVHVSLDAGGVVGRMLVDNAISPNEHEALLGWYDRGFDKGFAREYAGDATDSFSGNLSQRLTVDRWDLTRQKCSYKTEGDQRDKTTYVMEFDGVNTTIAETVLRLYAARIRKIMDLVVNEDPRVRYAEDGEGDAAEPIGEPCDKASANDARSGGGDGVRARATALTDDLAENFEDPEAIQLTTYQPRPQSGMAQHFDSRSRFLSIATMSLRASVKLVQIRAASRGPKDGMQRSEIRLLPRSIYLMSGPARANCHLKDEPNIQAQGNHKGCPCCWTHGIDTDQTEAQGRIGVTFRQLAPWALHEAELKRLADERAERDKAAEEGALQPRRRSTPATKRDAPTGPATWLSGEGADAVRAWRSTLTPDAWDALAAADGLTLNNVPARGWHREVKGAAPAAAPLPPAPKPHVASTTSAWVAACTDLLELAGKEKGGLAGLRGELESRGFRCGERKWEGKEFDVSMPQEFPCYYDIVGKDYSGGHRQDLMSSKPGLVTYLEGCLSLAKNGSAYRTTADRDADGDEAARRAGKRATKAQICFHRPGQFQASDALRSRSAVERYLAADATPLFESPALDAFSFENDVAGDFPSPPPGYYSRLSAKVVEQLRPAAPALTAASPAVVSPPTAAPPAVGAESESEIDEPVVESDGEDDPVWAAESPAKKPHAPTGGARWLATDGADAVRAWLTTLTPDAWDALAAADGLTRNNVPARGWHREVKGAAPAAPRTGGLAGLRGALMSRGFQCGQIPPSKSYYTISVPLEFPCYYDIVGKDITSSRDQARSMPQLMKYLQGALALVQTGSTYRLEAERKSDGGEAARRAASAKVTVVFHYPGQLGPTQVLRSRADVSRYLATNATPRFEAPPLDAFVFENSVEGAFPRPPPGYYSRLSAKVVEQLRLAAAPALPPSAMALPPAASAPPPPAVVEGAADRLPQHNTVAAGDWRIVGAQVQDVDDATVRGVVTDCRSKGWKEVTTTDGYVVMRLNSKLTQATLTPDEAARAVRPASRKDYVQARIDGAIRFNHGGREFKNCYTCADGTARQFEVTATHIRCALCSDAKTWSLATDCGVIIREVKQHCGQIRTAGVIPVSARQHLDCLVQSAGAPPTAEASTTPAPAPAAPAPPPPRPQNVRPQAVAASQRFAVDDLVQADFHAQNAYYDGVVVAARADGEKGFLYRIEYDDGDDEDDVPEERIRPAPKKTLRTRGSVWVGRRLKANANAPPGRSRVVGRIIGWLPVRGVKEPFLNAAGRPAPIYRVDYGGTFRDELETYELLDESTLLPPQTSEEWQREKAFADFLRERDVACKFSSSRPRELTARALYDKYAGAETVRAFFELGGTSEALVKEICQERCTIENVDALWSEYCAQTLDEGAEREKPDTSKAKKPVRPAAPLRVGSSVQTVAGAQDARGQSVAAVRGIVTELGTGWVTVLTTEGVEMKAREAWLKPAHLSSSEKSRCVLNTDELSGPSSARRVGDEVMPAKRARGPPKVRAAAPLAPKPSVKREREPDPRTNRLAVGTHVQHSDGLRGVVTRHTSNGYEVTTKTGYVAKVYGKDLREITLTAEEAALCDRSRLTPNEWLQAQLDGAVCAVYEGRTFGNCFATKDGRSQRTFTVESNGDVRCALCDWTAPSGASSELQNDISAWQRLFHCIKGHCGQTPSSLKEPGTQRHVERVLAMAAEPSTPPTATIDIDDGETPEPRRPSKRPRGAPPVHAAAALDAEPPQAASDAVIPAKKAQGCPRKVQAPPPPPPPPPPAAAAGYDWIVVGAKVQTVAGAATTGKGCDAVRGVVTDIGAWVTVLSTEGYEVKSRRAWLAPATLTDDEAARCARGPQQPAEWLQARIDGSICVRYGQREFKNQFSTTDGRVIRQFVVDSGTSNVRCALCDWKPQDGLNLRSGSGWTKLMFALRAHCGQVKGNTAGEALTEQHMEHVLSVAAAPAAVSAAPLPPPPPAVVEVAAAPLLQRVAAPAGDWCIIGARVQDVDDSTVRGVVTDSRNSCYREVTTTTGVVVMKMRSKLKPVSLTDEEAARAVRPVSQKDYAQARVDGAIRLRHGGREFKNCYTCADGTARRQFEVMATHVRCVLCGDAHSWSLERDFGSLLQHIKRHCSQLSDGSGTVPLYARQHLDRLALSAGAPPTASATPAPAPAVSPSPAPAEPPRAPAPDERIRVGMLIEAPPHVWGADYAEKVGSAKRYRGTVKARDSGEKLPIGCPAPMPDEPVWLVSYEDDGRDWATPERFLSIVAPVDGQRARRERTKPQSLSGCVDAGLAYVPTQDEDGAPGAPPAAQLPTPPPPAAPAPVVSPAPAPAVLPAPSPPRAPSPPAAGRICVGAVVAAESQVWGKGFVRKVGATKRFRGIVKARGNGDILPVGCPPPAEGERIWRVFYADDREDYDTPERFLDFVAPPGRVFIGAVVEAAPAAFGHDSTNSVAARYRGTVVEPGEAFNLPLGCPPIEPGEPVWNVRYYDDGKVWATPERFLSCAVVASGSSKRRRCSDNSTAIAAAEAAPLPLTARRVGGEVMPAKKARGPPEGWESLVSTAAAPRPSVKRERKPAPSPHDWVAVGAHVQHSNGLRGVVTKLGYNGFTDVTTKTGYAVTVVRTDLTKITLPAEEAALCDRFRLQPQEWLQAQIDGAVCAVYEGREFGNCFATKTGRTQRMFTVESNGDVRCALCSWTAPEGASTAMQNDLPTWKRLFHCIKHHSGQFASTLKDPATQQHVERVLAMAAEPSTPPAATTNADDDRETPEPRSLTAPAAPAVPPRPPTPAAPPRPPTPFRLPTRSDYGEVPPTTRLRKRSPPPDEVWSPPPRPEHARQTKKPRRFVEVDQDVPARAWREGSPRAASPSLVFAAPSSARFVPAKRWPEAGEECEFLVSDDHTHKWYLGHCADATEARVVLKYNASVQQSLRGQAHEFYKDDDKPAECIRLREDAPELPANIV